ncbi:MAG: lycopene cyclase family protein [Aquaticitalea sp.]
MQNERHFDYIIIGNGLAGLQLALKLSNDSFFDSHQIALIDPSDKSTNDKTWSFWEHGKGTWDSIVLKTWNEALFNSPNVSLKLPLSPYQYKSIPALDFYNWAKQILSSKSNVHLILDTIENIEESIVVKIKGIQANYTSKHVFDSRIPKEFYINAAAHTIIHQHFKGWKIETETPCFNSDSFTMMDYRFNYKGYTSFIYVLPFSDTQALVEFTFFTPFIVESSVYEEALKNYLVTHLQLKDYQILETEVGNIPMTDFPFWKFNSQKVTKIGTGGGWVKGSTGYSFKNTEKNVAKIIENIKKGNPPTKKLFKRKFKFYDKIFLEVLKTDNQRGIWIFEQFYSKNSIDTMFRFLDEETSFSEDLRIMQSLFSMTFIKAFFKVLFRF